MTNPHDEYVEQLSQLLRQRDCALLDRLAQATETGTETETPGTAADGWQ